MTFSDNEMQKDKSADAKTLADGLAEKIAQGFLMKLCLKLSEKLSDEQAQEISKKLGQLPAQLENADKSENISKIIGEKFKSIFKNDVPDIDNVIKEVWIQHLKDLGLSPADNSEHPE